MYAVAGGVLALCAIVFRSTARVALPLLAGALVLAGLAWAQLQRYHAPPASALHCIPTEPILSRVRAVIDDRPVLRDGAIEGTRSLACKVRLLALEGRGEWRAVSGDALLRIEPAGALELAPGQEISVIGEISRISPPANPGEYDWQAHCAREDVFLRLSVDHWEAVQKLGAPNTSLLWRAKAAARDALASGFRGEENRALALALLFGDSSDSLEEAWADFRASGTAHHLSISGTHIAILTAFLVLIGRCFMLHPRTVLITAALFALAYASLARPSPPVVRSVLLCMAIAAAVLLRRNTDPLQCLFVAVLAMLLYSPMDLMSPGFQLSFGAVAALMLLTGRVISWFWALENEHDRVARLIRPPRGAAAVKHWALRTLVQASSAGLVAYCVSMPLIALHFRQLNPWAIPGSLLLAPFVTAALITGLIKTAVCAIFASAGPVLAIPAEAMTGAMRWSVGLLAQLPGAEVGLSSIQPWMAMFYAAMLFAPLARPLARWRHRWALPCVAVVLFTTAPLLPNRSYDRTVVTFLSVGNGSCTVIELPDGRTVLVDCGAARQRDLFARTIQPFLRERGIRRIDSVIVTHPDSDHTLALDDIVEAYGSRIHRELPPGPVAELAGPVSFDVLSPSAAAASDNDSSTVLRVQYAGRSVLFTGDIEQDAIASLLRSRQALQSDVLVAPHHGSFETNTPDLLALVRPEWIICSSSSRLSGLQERFAKTADSVPLKRTGISSAITVTISSEGKLDVRGLRDQASP